jgi:hypothetical protein
MIRLRDAGLLAITKLRTRRLRTVITLVISGLLFASLAAALLVFEGSLHSATEFSKQGLGARYIVAAVPDPSKGGNVMSDPDIIARAQQIYADTVAAKKAAAKEMGVTYDPTTEPLPTVTFAGSASSPTFLSFASAAAIQAMQEYSDAHPAPGRKELQAVASRFHPIDTYTATSIGVHDGTLATMQHGQEDFAAMSPTGNQSFGQDVLLTNQVSFMPTQLTRPFMLPGAATNAAAQANPDAIPMVVPYGIATRMLGLQKLPGSATANQKLDRVRELYAKAGSATLVACYRNTVSSSQIQTAISTAEDIAKNKGNKQYVKPSLIYGLPSAESCAAAPVTTDTRTKKEKQDTAKLDAFNARFGQIVEPDQQKITFRIVGLVPDVQNAPSNSAAGILQGLVGSSLQGVIAIPNDLYSRLPSVKRYDSLLKTQSNPTGFSPNAYYAEFGSDVDARKFIDTKSCIADDNGKCASSAKPFLLSAFGSNSIALRDVQRRFNRLFNWAALVVCVLGVVIMTGTVGRVLADGRKETAVFRAIGANRLDIVVVYGLYTLLLSLMIAALSLVLGFVAARVFHEHYWRTATAQARLAFGGGNTQLYFSLLAYSSRIWLVALASVATGMLSMIFPMLRNVRRSPIRDMRDE